MTTAAKTKPDHEVEIKTLRRRQAVTENQVDWLTKMLGAGGGIRADHYHALLEKADQPPPFKAKDEVRHLESLQKGTVVKHDDIRDYSRVEWADGKEAIVPDSLLEKI